MPNERTDATKRLKMGTASARAKRTRDFGHEMRPQLPWKSIGKWASIILIVAVVGTGGYVYVTTRPTPEEPIDFSRCPKVSELLGTVKAIRNAIPVELKTGDSIPPNTFLQPNSGCTMRISYADGTDVALYPSSRMRTDTDYGSSVTLVMGHLFIVAKESPFIVKSRHGVGRCANAKVHFEVGQSRLRGNCEDGEMTLTNAKRNRVLRIRPGLWGEVGTGAHATGVKNSEETVEMSYPLLEITKIALINADKDTTYPSFNPMKDGAVFVKTTLAPKLFDFRISTNSSKTQKLKVSIKKMEPGTLVPVHDLESFPVLIKDERTFGVFGAKLDGEYVDFTGSELDLGDYLMTITPYGPPRDGKSGNGRTVSIRFSLVE